MHWIDQAGYACAAGWSGHYCVTVYVGGIRFVRPIQIGDLVEVHAQVILTGRSSMHVAIDVRAGDPRTADRGLTTHCIIVFAALDANGQTLAVPAFVPADEQGRSLNEYARRLVELRRDIDAEMDRQFAD